MEQGEIQKDFFEIPDKMEQRIASDDKHEILSLGEIKEAVDDLKALRAKLAEMKF